MDQHKENVADDLRKSSLFEAAELLNRAALWGVRIDPDMASRAGEILSGEREVDPDNSMRRQ